VTRPCAGNDALVERHCQKDASRITKRLGPGFAASQQQPTDQSELSRDCEHYEKRQEKVFVVR
jgi:hypothetical protein